MKTSPSREAAAESSTACRSARAQLGALQASASQDVARLVSADAVSEGAKSLLNSIGQVGGQAGSRGGSASETGALF